MALDPVDYDVQAQLVSSNRTIRARWTLPTTLAEALSDRFVLTMPQVDGVLTSVRVASEDAVEYDLSLFQAELAASQSVDHILHVTDIEQVFHVNDTPIHFCNTDEAQSNVLYAEINNTSMAETGAVTLELFISPLK